MDTSNTDRPSPALTPKQRAFVHHWSEGHARTTAARLAGYADPSHAQAELMANPRVLAALVDAAHDRLVSWRKLGDKAMAVLEYMLDPANYTPPPDGSKPAVSASQVNSAARTVLNVVSRVAPHLLRDDIPSDDESAGGGGPSDADLARSMLGPFD